MKKVLVFGVFDRLHPGHRHFLEVARREGDELVVALARDSAVRVLKKKMPVENETVRREALSKFEAVSRVILGDETRGEYGVLRAERPDVICVGYDQRALLADLQKKMDEGAVPRAKIVSIGAHEPHRWHSSLLI